MADASARQIAKFITDRHSPERTFDDDGRFGRVSFGNNSGLGQPSNWTGRQDELRALDAWWFSSIPGAWLGGLGGLGKTGLLQTWVTALSSLGYSEPVSVSVLYLRGSEVDIEKMRQMLSGDPRDAKQHKLFLLDGYNEAQHEQQIEEFLTRAIVLGIRPIVTSRTSVVRSLARHFTDISVSGLTRQDSVGILAQFGIREPDSEALAAEAGDNPLALHLVSRLVTTENKTPSELLKEFRLMQEKPSSTNLAFPGSIRAVLTNSVGHLTADVQSLLKALCRNTEDVTEMDALSGPAIRDLADAGLVQVDHLDQPGRVSIHPMIRRFVNEEL